MVRRGGTCVHWDAMLTTCMSSLAITARRVPRRPCRRGFLSSRRVTKRHVLVINAGLTGGSAVAQFEGGTAGSCFMRLPGLRVE